MSSAAPRRRWLHRAVLVLVSAGLCLVVVELGLRAVGYSYRLYPERIEFGWPQPKTMGWLFEPDPDLFWVPKVPVPYAEMLAAARQLEPTVVFMGCSCTQFGGFAQPAQTAVEQAFPGKTLPQANLGVGGWSSFQGLQQLRRDVVPLRPVVVFVFYGWNDHWMGFGIEDKRVHEMNHGWLAGLQDLRLGQLVGRAVVAVAGDAGEFPARVAPADFERNLRDIVALARGAGITPVLVTAPSGHRADGDLSKLRSLTERHIRDLEQLIPVHERYVELVREVARTDEVALCDLHAEFAALPAAKLGSYFHDDGIHFTAPGGVAVSLSMLDCLRRNGLLEAVLRDRP